MKTENACKRCGCINTLDSSNIIRKDVYTADKKYYKVTYFKCKQCKDINVVQVDDVETINLYRDFKKLLVKVMKKRVKNETVSPKDVKKKDKYMKLLRAKRAVLREATEGLSLYDENGNVFVNALTFGEDGVIINDSM